MFHIINHHTVFLSFPITRSSRKKEKQQQQKIEKLKEISFTSLICAEMHLIHMSCVKKTKQSWQNMRNDISDINSLAFSVHLILLIGWNRLFTIISFMSFVLLFYSFIFFWYFFFSRIQDGLLAIVEVGLWSRDGLLLHFLSEFEFEYPNWSICEQKSIVS